MRRAKWNLTPEAFHRLLAEFDPDPARAGARYEDTRRALVFLFERHGCDGPEDLADEAFDRVARRLLAGESIGNLPAFFRGVARMLIHEHWHTHRRHPVPIDDNAASIAAPLTPSSIDPRRSERMADCLDRCLAHLAPDQRTLMTEYYLGEKGVKISNRKLLAARLGVSMDLLGLRAFRIRKGLKSCLTSCLDGDPE